MFHEKIKFSISMIYFFLFNISLINQNNFIFSLFFFEGFDIKRYTFCQNGKSKITLNAKLHIFFLIF